MINNKTWATLVETAYREGFTDGIVTDRDQWLTRPGPQMAEGWDNSKTRKLVIEIEREDSDGRS